MYQWLQRIKKKADNIKENIKENISLGILTNPQGFKDFFDFKKNKIYTLGTYLSTWI